jgi:DNA-binding response OmpR family regulator
MKKSSAKILIVEDEALIGWSLANALKKAGFTVVIAETGEKALEKLSSSGYDLVITDLNLPHIDGFEVASFVKKFSSDIPVLMMTTKDKNFMNDPAHLTNVDNVIEKPFNLKEIITLVTEYTHRKAACN